MTKIIADLEKHAVAEDFLETGQQLLGKVEKWVIDLAFCADIDVDLPKLSISSLLKSTGLCIKDDFVSLPEKLLTYIDLATRYKLCQIFVFVNLRSFWITILYRNLPRVAACTVIKFCFWIIALIPGFTGSKERLLILICVKFNILGN